MQFLYFDRGGDETIKLDGEEFNYLFKVRRHKKDRPIYIRNRAEPKIIYRYEIETIERRKATLKLAVAVKEFQRPEKRVTLGWCVVDSKTIEKTLPMVNELGVAEIVFIYCQYSQKDIELDFERFERILESSSMQSGRYNIPELRTMNSVQEFLEEYPESIAVDFSEDKLQKCDKNSLSLLIGAEGGFSEEEREGFKNIAGLNSPYILRSQTAVVSALSILI
jgi:16S rRNA (uracil1498-N3)-methyltransferase